MVYSRKRIAPERTAPERTAPERAVYKHAASWRLSQNQCMQQLQQLTLDKNDFNNY